MEFLEGMEFICRGMSARTKLSWGTSLAIASDWRRKCGNVDVVICGVLGFMLAAELFLRTNGGRLTGYQKLQGISGVDANIGSVFGH
jgi:hypothetical protein